MFFSQVTTIIDGCFQKEVSLEYVNNFMNAHTTNDSRLFIGHGVSLGEIDQATGSWQLGNIFLFKGTSTDYIYIYIRLFVK